MKTENITAVILAAGKGKRMGIAGSKVLIETVAKKTIIEHLLSNIIESGVKKLVIVVGYQAEEVKKTVSNFFNSQSNSNENLQYDFALQEEQLGTGHAVQMALPLIKDSCSEILILNGDVPLITPSTIQSLIAKHSSGAPRDLTFLTVPPAPGAGYAKVERDCSGKISRVIERRDCETKHLLYQEENAGIYFVNKTFLQTSLKDIKNQNAQKEYYLTDIIAQAAKQGSVESLFLDDLTQAQGVNTQQDLDIVNSTINTRIIEHWQASGVSFAIPNSCLISAETFFHGPATVGANSIILGKTSIGNNVTIEGSCLINDSSIADQAVIKFCTRIEDSQIGELCQVGPFAHLRPKTILESESKVGNFVETKAATLHKGVKASHLSYIGDAEIGEHSNIGAGTIFANYDGKNKFKTKIGDNCFIGSNSTLVAPLNVGDRSTIGAGSVIRKNVDDNSLALTKGELVEKKNWQRKDK